MQTSDRVFWLIATIPLVLTAFSIGYTVPQVTGWVSETIAGWINPEAMLLEVATTYVLGLIIGPLFFLTGILLPRKLNRTQPHPSEAGFSSRRYRPRHWLIGVVVGCLVLFWAMLLLALDNPESSAFAISITAFIAAQSALAAYAFQWTTTTSLWAPIQPSNREVIHQAG